MKTIVFLLIASTLVSGAEPPTPGAVLSPAEKRIAATEARLKQEPKRASLHAELAEAYVRRARETGEAQFLDLAVKSVDHALKLEADSYEGLRARLAVLVARESYTNAVELGASLNRRLPDDVVVYGLLAAAYMGLGNYDEAERQAQWMINMRRGNLGGITRGALLREVWGDGEGAIDWLQSAYRLTSTSESEERAWLVSQMARIRRNEGRLDEAATLVARAEQLFPHSPVVVEERVRLELARKNKQSAAEAARRLNADPRRLCLLAKATESPADWDRFRTAALANSDQPANANRELVFDYARSDPAQALRIAQKEAERRQDVYTLDALAWALFSTGDYAAAAAIMDRVVKTGIRSQEFNEHEAAIRAARK